MPSTEQLRQDIQRLNPDDLQELAIWIMRRADLLWHLGLHWSHGIESTPDICGGEPRIIRTRIPVWVLHQMRQLGMSESEILRSYPALRAEDLVNAWAYVDLHRQEIQEQIMANEEA